MFDVAKSKVTFLLNMHGIKYQLLRHVKKIGVKWDISRDASLLKAWCEAYDRWASRKSLALSIIMMTETIMASQM